MTVTNIRGAKPFIPAVKGAMQKPREIPRLPESRTEYEGLASRLDALADSHLMRGEPYRQDDLKVAALIISAHGHEKHPAVVVTPPDET